MCREPHYKCHRRRRGLSSSTCSEFFRDFCVCCRHFPSHVWDKMCPDVNENPRAFGPSSLWGTDGTVHNNGLDIKRSSVDDLFLSFQHFFRIFKMNSLEHFVKRSRLAHISELKQFSVDPFMPWTRLPASLKLRSTCTALVSTDTMRKSSTHQSCFDNETIF